MSERRPTDDEPRKRLTDRQAYNVVSDTVTGANLRLRDNLFQGVAVLVFALIGVGVGYFLMPDNRLTGALLGLVGGLIVGVLASGTFLMIFRAVRHARGKHD
jgi:hypothetical protein